MNYLLLSDARLFGAAPNGGNVFHLDSLISSHGAMPNGSVIYAMVSFPLRKYQTLEIEVQSSFCAVCNPSKVIRSGVPFARQVGKRLLQWLKVVSREKTGALSLR